MKLRKGDRTNAPIWLIAMMYVCIVISLAGCMESGHSSDSPQTSEQLDTPPVTNSTDDADNIKPITGAKPVINAINLSEQSLLNVPMTFGEPFLAGDIPDGQTVMAYMNGHSIPTQVNEKATNSDGSLRHAVVTVQIPKLKAETTQPLELRPVPRAMEEDVAVSLSDLLASKFEADITLTIAGQPWHLDARALLRQAKKNASCRPYGQECNRWLSGPLVSAWVVGGPLLNSASVPNPHLAAYFVVRAYGPAPVTHVLVDVIVENDWAYAPEPHNITYDATIDVGGQTVYSINDLKHYRQTRWHKVLWWGGAIPVYPRQSSSYLQSTHAVPRYQNVPAPDAWLAKQRQMCAPMEHCDQTNHMGKTGAQAGIGPLPRWTSAYIINPTISAFNWMIANNDALGSYPVHYRDHETGQWLSITDHPCATLIWHPPPDRCPVPPHGNDRLPECPQGADCKVPWQANIAHDPAPAYVAYTVTGAWYYLSELTNWANWELLGQNQGYRGYAKGYVHKLPLRAQAWALRTLGDAAYILPDNHPFKKTFNQSIDNNLNWYNEHYTDSSNANSHLHVITNSSLVYSTQHDKKTGLSTWQNSFFIWSIGNLKDLGFAGADRFLDWVGAFQVNLMTSPDFCWTLASSYKLRVRDAETGPLYTSMAELYAKNFPELLGAACNSSAVLKYITQHTSGKYKYNKGEMIGYPWSPTGYPANFQIGLAATVDSNIPRATEAWQIFSTRANKPNYTKKPQFAIIPRNLN